MRNLAIVIVIYLWDLYTRVNLYRFQSPETYKSYKGNHLPLNFTIHVIVCLMMFSLVLGLLVFNLLKE